MIRLALMPMDKVLIRKPSGERHTQTKEPCEGGDRDRSDVVTGQGVPRNPRSSKRKGRFFRAFRRRIITLLTS